MELSLPVEDYVKAWRCHKLSSTSIMRRQKRFLHHGALTALVENVLKILDMAIGWWCINCCMKRRRPSLFQCVVAILEQCQK